ncbi:MAG: curlin [Pseudomonadota bacterium]
MSRKRSTRRLSAACAALLVLHAATPADAGSVSLTITPKGESATAIRQGLQIYSWAKSIESRARISQKGTGNAAAIGQSGSGNWAGIFQRGSGHTGTISQSGDNNAYGLFQFGRNTTSNVTQSGNGKVGFTFLGGW